MSKKEKNLNMDLEESKMTPPGDLGADDELKTEEQEAMEAIRKFTNEDDNELGEISVKSILGGDFLMSKFMIKQIMFVMFCVLLMILYTGNRYDSQQDIILIDSLRGRLQEVKYNVLTQSSELMNLTRQSNVEKSLRGTPDSLLHNSITPPFLIKANSSQVKADEKEFEEVLVDSQELAPQEAEPKKEEVNTQTEEVKAKTEEEVKDSVNTQKAAEQ